MNYCNPQKVIDIALSQIGYLEKKTGDLKYLYDFTANAGKNNFTKYGYDLMQWLPSTGDTYGINYAWCDQLIDWCYIKAYGLELAKKLLGGWSAYTPTSAEYFEEKGLLKKKPQLGAQIFFYDENKISPSRPHGIYHTGLVVSYDNNFVTTVEGNTSSDSGVVENGGCVAKKKYPLNYSKIYGYGVPNFEAQELAIQLKNYENFIKEAYLTTFGRQTDANGLKTWTTAMQHGMTETEVLFKLRNSIEAKNREQKFRKIAIGLAYYTLLNRPASNEEIHLWDTTKSIDTIIEKIKKSPEYKKYEKEKK